MLFSTLDGMWVLREKVQMNRTMLLACEISHMYEKVCERKGQGWDVFGYKSGVCLCVFMHVKGGV